MDGESMTTDRNEVILRFRALRSSVPLAVRVRQLFEHALRTCNLRCVKVEGLPDDAVKQEETKQR
jgi:hypothetical protein